MITLVTHHVDEEVAHDLTSSKEEALRTIVELLSLELERAVVLVVYLLSEQLVDANDPGAICKLPLLVLVTVRLALLLKL